MPGEDQLPAGSHRDLIEALHELYRGAGLPGLRKIADAVAGDDSFHDSVSHEKVGAILRGDGVPRWSKLEPVVRTLAAWHTPRLDVDAQALRFHQLWLSARGGSTGESERPVSAVTEIRRSEFVECFKQVAVTYESPKNYYEEDSYDQERRQGASSRTREQQAKLVGRLTAALSQWYEPRNVVPKYSDSVQFPGGSIETRQHSDIRDPGYVSSIWFEIEIAVDFDHLDVLSLMTDHVGEKKLTVVKSAFRFSKQTILAGIAQDLHTRGIHLSDRSAYSITLDSLSWIEGASLVIKNGSSDSELLLMGHEVIGTDAVDTFERLIKYLNL